MAEIFVMRGAEYEKQGLRDLANFAKFHAEGRLLTLVEVGSYAGESMEVFASTGVFSKILCVDPWKNGYDDDDAASTMDIAFAEKLFDARAERAKSKYNVEIVKYKCIFDEFLEKASLLDRPDIVYIDACHKYEAVKHDIQQCLDKLMPKIAICGHDYGNHIPSVCKAVNEIFSRLDFVFCDTSWVKLTMSDE